LENARSLPSEIVTALEQASGAFRGHTTGAIERATGNVREYLARQTKMAELNRKELELSVVQAQIMSRLWWLKIQGKMQEYADYERNASRLLKMMHDQIRDGREGIEKTAAKKKTAFLDLRREMYRRWSCKGGCAGGSEGGKDSNTRGGGRKPTSTWKKWMGGV
jgi:hypothetical protein